MIDNTTNLLCRLKVLCEVVEYHDGHHPQPRVNDVDCAICVALFEAHEAIKRAEAEIFK